MRRVRFDDRAIARYRRVLGESTTSSWSRRARAIAAAVAIFTLVAHAGEATGSFPRGTDSAVRGVRMAVLSVVDDRESAVMNPVRDVMLVSVFAMAPFARGAELLVPEQFQTIQAAVSSSVAGDIVSVAPGDYTESITLQGKAIALISRVPLAAIIRAPGESRAIRFESGETPRTSVSGFQFAGNKSLGGGILVANASPVITHCSFVGVRNPTGGGVLVTGGNPRLGYCHFQGCVAEAVGTGFGSGGAIRKTAGSMSIEDCAFLHNAGPGNADAIMNEAGQMHILRCDLGEHDSEGAYLYNGDAGDMLIEDCVFHDDPTPNSAICFSWGVRQVRGCVFRNLLIKGAAIHSSARHTVVDGCTFSNLTSTHFPGAAIARNTTNASFAVSNSVFCGTIPAAMGAPYEDLGSNTFETTCIAPCPADLVVDSTVNAADMAIVLNFWGTDGSQFPGVDIDADGIVSGADLAAVLSAWGPCPQ